MSADMSNAGRVCPVDYNYSPSTLARLADLDTEVLYVVGGLYGNLQALQAVEVLGQGEQMQPLIIFNGDFHFMDADPEWFGELDSQVAKHRAIRGNVETEISRKEDIGAGCGCAYPTSVSDEVVKCSNEIIRDLHAVAASLKGVFQRLSQLPMDLVVQVGSLRIGIVHGDATALAGWRFSSEALDDPTNRPWLAEIAANSKIDVFASTHTGTAVLREFNLDRDRRLTIINNGAAGIPNFCGTTHGVISRIATRSSPHPTLYGTKRDGVHVDALAVPYDQSAFLSRLLKRWPEGSPVHRSYYSRIVAGPNYTIEQANPFGPKS